MAQSPGVFRSLLRTEGSLIDGLQTAQNEPTWHTTSLSTYNSWIRNGRTGARPLNLALITVGGTNANLIQRPVANENVTAPVLLNERLFTKASLRVMLSDFANDITSLPGVTATAPVQLDGAWRAAPPNNGNPYGPVDATHPPVARSAGLVTAPIAGDVAGTNKVLTVAVPAVFKVPGTLTVTKGAANYVLTGCSGTKTATTFTCTAGTLGVDIAPPATVSGAVTTPLEGTFTVSTPLNATWVANGRLMTSTHSHPSRSGSTATS